MSKFYFTLLLAVFSALVFAGSARANDVTYIYDNLHRVKYALNSNGLNMRYYYDDNGNIISIKKGWNDADFDGIPDDIEKLSCTNYLDADSDDDGIPDGVEDANHNGVLDPGETDPCSFDTDGDGLSDGYELGYTSADIDEDTDPTIFQADPDPVTTTDPTVANGTIYDVYIHGIVPTGTYTSPRNFITRNICSIPTGNQVVLSAANAVFIGGDSNVVLSGVLTITTGQ